MSSEATTSTTHPTDQATTPSNPVKLAISAIICTRDRPAMIVQAVESIAMQEYPNFEVILIDQSASEDTRRLIEPLAERYPHIRYFHVDVVGHSRAYNAAVEHATGTILAFTDDDCIADSNWLTSIEQGFQCDPSVALLYGQVLAADDFKNSLAGRGVIPELPIRKRRYLNHREGFEVFGMGANFAVLQSVCQEIGGFDEVLGLGAPLKCANDFDFAFRVFRSNYTILLEPDAIVYHYGVRAYPLWPQTLKTYGHGDGAFYMKHVRAGDVFAARLLVVSLGRAIAHELIHVVKHGWNDTRWEYVRHFFVGMYASYKFGVDRRTRLYYLR